MDRYVKAAKHYLDIMGHEYLGSFDNNIIYADECDDIHIAIVRKDWEEPRLTNKVTTPLVKEALPFIWTWEPDVQIMFDYIGIMPDSEEKRAIVQHHINVMVRSDEDE